VGFSCASPAAIPPASARTGLFRSIRVEAPRFKRGDKTSLDLWALAPGFRSSLLPLSFAQLRSVFIRINPWLTCFLPECGLMIARWICLRPDIHIAPQAAEPRLGIRRARSARFASTNRSRPRSGIVGRAVFHLPRALRTSVVKTASPIPIRVHPRDPRLPLPISSPCSLCSTW
jgi:hypothetical protein